MTRLSRLIHVGILLGIALLLMAAITTDNRSYAVGRYALELDGQFAGWLNSAEGGNATADVINEPAGPDYIVRKHIGQPQYEDIIIQVSAGMSEAFYKWIDASFNKNYSRKDGAIVAADFNYKEQSRLTFTDALITEIGFPALDAASKDPAYMTIKFAPETTKRVPSKGGTVGGAAAGKGAAVQKKWLPANFRLKIDGLDQPTSKVNKIEALVIKQKVTENPVGEARDAQIELAHLEFPNLVITLAEAYADPFYDWHDDFVIKGNSAEANEKNGTLEVLTPNLQDVLFTLTFKSLGIFNVATEKGDAGAEAIKRVKAEMYVEEMTFDYKGLVGK
ncbi:MAG: phage tail protein [Dehalococcoidia bacterium]|nr:phage tail protein [Dehalococcoidia bacterium]